MFGLGGSEYRCPSWRHRRVAQAWRWTAALAAVVALAAAGCSSAAHAATGGTQPSTTATSTKQIRVMIMGDSITQETTGDYTWRYRLAEHLSLTAPGLVNFVGDRSDVYDDVASKQGSHAYADPLFDSDHSAVWGDALSLEMPKVQALVQKIPTDVLIVALGGNDRSCSGMC